MADQSPLLQFRVGIAGAFVAPLIFLGGVIAYFVIFHVFDMNALSASGLAGLVVASLFARSYADFWDAVMDGVATRTAVMLLLILLVVSLFAALLEITQVASGFVWLATTLGVSGGLFVPAIFVMTCAMAVATGTSLGTLFTAFPIFYPAGVAVGADPLLLAGAILSGALFGDNLAPISDSTVVSSSTQRYRSRDGVAEIGGVVRSRARYALTAAAISLVIFLIVGPMYSGATTGAAAQATIDAASASPLIMLIPVILLLFTAFWKRDIFLATTVGIVSGVLVGLTAGLLQPADILSATPEGTPGGFLVAGVDGILPLIGLGIVIFGIIGVIRAAGIFDVIVDMALRSRFTNTARGAEAVIGIGAIIAGGLFAGVNGPCMIMYGPVADRIGAQVGLHPYRRANVMDCCTLGLGSIVPVVSAFLLIASLLTQGYESAPEIGALAIFPVAVYPLVLTVVMAFAIITGWGRRFEGPNGAELRTPAAAAITDNDHAVRSASAAMGSGAQEPGA